MTVCVVASVGERTNQKCLRVFLREGSKMWDTLLGSQSLFPCAAKFSVNFVPGASTTPNGMSPVPVHLADGETITRAHVYHSHMGTRDAHIACEIARARARTSRECMNCERVHRSKHILALPQWEEVRQGTDIREAHTCLHSISNTPELYHHQRHAGKPGRRRKGYPKSLGVPAREAFISWLAILIIAKATYIRSCARFSLDASLSS